MGPWAKSFQDQSQKKVPVAEGKLSERKEDGRIPSIKGEESSKEEEVGDFPGDAVDKTLRSQCRGPGFDSWSGN